MNIVMLYILHGWFKAYAQKPRVTVIVSLLFLLAFVSAIYFVDKRDREHREAVRQQSLSYEIQITELNKMESSLHVLTDFVQDQKQKLKESEELVAALKTEQARLQPVVEADRRAIQAVFDLQEERNRASVRRERWIGFGLGVLASFVASFIFAVIVQMWKRNAKIQG